jgi:hypothetical protein
VRLEIFNGFGKFFPMGWVEKVADDSCFHGGITDRWRLEYDNKTMIGCLVDFYRVFGIICLVKKSLVLMIAE